MYRRRYRKSAPLSTSAILLICGGSILLLLLAFVGENNVFEGIDLGVLIFFLVVMAGVIYVCVRFFLQKAGEVKFKNTTLSKVDEMTGIEFEQFVKFLYEKQGYRVETTAVSGDMGVDLVAQKGEERIAIQVKRYKGFVGRSAVSDAVAGKLQYRCNRCAVVTNSYFSTLAKRIAFTNYCKLIDRDKLGQMILLVNEEAASK